jgi:hypothetical protein
MCNTKLDTKEKKQISSKLSKTIASASKCQSSKKLLQLLVKDKLLFDGTLGDWKTKPVSFQAMEENKYTRAELSRVLKTHKLPSSKKLRGCVSWG